VCSGIIQELLIRISAISEATALGVEVADEIFDILGVTGPVSCVAAPAHELRIRERRVAVAKKSNAKSCDTDQSHYGIYSISY
jgi:hypothetical protein